MRQNKFINYLPNKFQIYGHPRTNSHTNKQTTITVTVDFLFHRLMVADAYFIQNSTHTHITIKFMALLS